jgi:hypothetical protein
MDERRNDLEIAMERAIVLRDPTRIDLLFTMSEIPHADPVKDHTCEVMFRGRICFGSVARQTARLRPIGLRRGSLRYDRLAEP